MSWYLYKFYKVLLFLDSKRYHLQHPEKILERIDWWWFRMKRYLLGGTVAIAAFALL